MSDRERAHELIERLPESHIGALVGLLETIVDPVSAALRNAPIDDEPETEEEKQSVAASKEWLRNNPGIPFEDVVSELGFTMDQIRGGKSAA